MKADQARVRDLLTQTITLMCKNGLEFCRDLRVEGLLAVTVDGTDVFVIHMDEKVTDRPSYATGSRYTENITTHQHRDSASGVASGADDIPVSHLNDDLFPSTSSAVSDGSERSSAFRTEDVHSLVSIKTEPDVDESDDEVVIMESDVKPLISSNIPLPVVEGMNECEDGGPSYTSLSPASKKRRMLERRTVAIPASVECLLDDQHGNAHLWSGTVSRAPNSNPACIPLMVDNDDTSYHTSTYDMALHASFLSANGSQVLVSCRY